MKPCPSDYKAVSLIPLLRKERERHGDMRYGACGLALHHPQRFLGNILDRIGAWCRAQHKQSLALLVVDDTGKPRPGMYKTLPNDLDPVTPENYEERRARLYAEDWRDVGEATAEDVADAYAEAVGKRPHRPTRVSQQLSKQT